MRADTRKIGRRAMVAGAAAAIAAMRTQAQGQSTNVEQASTRLVDIRPDPTATITVERQGDIVLVGLNRPFIQNRLDPPTRAKLGETYYLYDHDPTLRALVLFGHGESFSRGIDVDAQQAALAAG